MWSLRGKAFQAGKRKGTLLGDPLGKLDSLGGERGSWSNLWPSKGGLTIQCRSIRTSGYKGTGKVGTEKGRRTCVCPWGVFLNLHTLSHIDCQAVSSPTSSFTVVSAMILSKEFLACLDLCKKQMDLQLYKTVINSHVRGGVIHETENAKVWTNKD